MTKLGQTASAEHSYFPYSPIVERERLSWPAGAKLAFAIVISLEHYDLVPPPNAFIPPNLPGGFGRAPYPDFRAFTQREYGNRVGAFRLMDTLERYGLAATIAIDTASVERCSGLVADIKRRGWDVIGHGHAVTRVISSAMSEQEERDFIEAVLGRLESAFGIRPVGWHGAEYGESRRTPDLLTSLGVRYVLDWPNDEQPYPMLSPSGRLLSLPMAIDFDDVFAHWHRRISMDRWQASIIDAVEQLLDDGTQHGRMLILNLHPWLIGQPWRISHLEELLGKVRNRAGIWWTTTRAISDWAASIQLK